MENNKVSEFLIQRSAPKVSGWKKSASERVKKPWLRDSKKIAFLILQKMREDNISRIALAESLNVSNQYLGKILKGEQNLTLETISKLKSALNIDIIEICKHKKKQVQHRVYLMNIKTMAKSVSYGKDIFASRHSFTLPNKNLKHEC